MFFVLLVGQVLFAMAVFRMVVGPAEGISTILSQADAIASLLVFHTMLNVIELLCLLATGQPTQFVIRAVQFFSN